VSRRDFFERPRRPARLRAAAAAGAALVVGVLLGPPLASVAAEAAGLVRDGLLRLEDATVVGARRLPAAALVRAAGVPRGTPLLEVDPEAVAARVEALAGVRVARVWRLPTGRLVIGVREREPRARVAAAAPAAWQAVDAAGVPFAPVDAAELAGLPEVRTRAPLRPGEPHPQLAAGVALLRAAEARGLRVASVGAGDDGAGLALRLPGIPARFVLGEGSWEEPLARLVRLLGRRPQLALRASNVDLRFAGQAVLRGGGEVLGAPKGAPPEASPPGAAEASTRSAAG